MPERIVIAGGTVVTPEGARLADLGIEGERIAGIHPPGTVADGERVDAHGSSSSRAAWIRTRTC